MCKNEIKNSYFNWFSDRGLNVEAVIYHEEIKYLFHIYDIKFEERIYDNRACVDWTLLEKNDVIVDFKSYSREHEEYSNKDLYELLVKDFLNEFSLYKENKKLYDNYFNFIKNNYKKTFIAEMHYAPSTEGGLSVTFVNPKTMDAINISNINDYDKHVYIRHLSSLDSYPTNKDNDSSFKRKSTKLIKDFNLIELESVIDKISSDLNSLSFSLLNEFLEKIKENTENVKELDEKRDKYLLLKNIIRELEHYCKISKTNIDKLKKYNITLPDSIEEFVQNENNLFSDKGNIIY